MKVQNSTVTENDVTPDARLMNPDCRSVGNESATLTSVTERSCYTLTIFEKNCSIMQMETHFRICHHCLWYYKYSHRLLMISAAHRSSTSYYDLLGVKPDASLEEIKNAFFDKSKKLHPDSDLSNPSLHTQFVKLNEAYRVLSKEVSRKEYDFRLRHRSSADHGFRSSSSSYSQSTAEPSDHTQYWEQFRNAQDFSEEDLHKKKKKNLHLVGYCIVAMLLSIGAHYFGFR